jgi:hypothetical protein
MLPQWLNLSQSCTFSLLGITSMTKYNTIFSMMNNEGFQKKGTIISKQALLMENKFTLLHPMHGCHLYKYGLQ